MKKGNMNVRSKLIEHNLGLVAHEIRKYSNFDGDEMFSIGVIGLIKGVDSFDMDKGFKFSTYAIRCINNEILIFLRDTKRHSIDSISFDNPITLDGETQSTIEDFIADNKADVTLSCEQKETLKILENLINSFSEEERMVLINYFGLFNQPLKTQCEIAEILGFSQAKVSKTLSKSLSKLKEYLYDMGISSYGDVYSTDEQAKQLLSTKKSLRN